MKSKIKLFISALVLTFLLNGCFSFFAFKKNTIVPMETEGKSGATGLNTAENVSYLTMEEKWIIYYCNIARMDGKLFLDTILTPYLTEKGIKSTTFVKSLIKDLEKTRDLPLLFSQQDLFQAAKGHAESMGNKGKIGHDGFEKRMKPFMTKYNKGVAENCQYGYQSAKQIVIDLLIDEGVSSLGHRKNILNASYNCVGVSIQPHKSYKYNCVMDFGGK